MSLTKHVIRCGWPWALSFGLLIGGCSNTPDQERKDVSVGNIKPGVAVRVEAAGAVVPATPVATGSVAPTLAASTNGQGSAAPAAVVPPKECTEYKELIEKLSSCTKMQEEVRTALRASFIKDADNWGATEPNALSAQASGCAQRAQQVKDVATKLCGW